MTSFPDHFSGHAREYSRYRPVYPATLFDFISERLPRRGLAWDCATGTGRDPLEPLAPVLRDLWGGSARTVRWPLYLRLGQLP